MTKRKFGSAFAFVLASAVLGAHAQSIRPTYSYPLPPKADEGPASIQIGSSAFFVTPFVGLAVGHDDNVLMTPRLERSSALYVASPGLKIDARSAHTVFQVGYQGEFGRYVDSSPDDYSNHIVNAQFDASFDRRNFLRLGADYTRGSEPRGSTDRRLSAEPDKYRIVNPSFTYAFGAPDARGRVEIYGNMAELRYLNNRTFTESGDRDQRNLGGAVYIRVAPRTYVMAEARGTRIRYVQPNVNEADERRYYAGLAWEATAATTGVLKFGRVERDFTSNVPDFSGGSYEAMIRWAPRTYSRFEFYAERSTHESTGLGNFILTDAGGAKWTHDWGSYWSTGVEMRYQKDKYQGFDRKDDTIALGLKVGYRFRRWLTFGAEYNYIERDSTLDSSDYDRNRYFLTATASM